MTRPGRIPRRTQLAAFGAVVLVVLALAGAWLWNAGRTAGGELDRSDPVAVASAFAQRYAVRDPLACELAGDGLRVSLDRSGLCAGPNVARDDVRVVVLQARTCGLRHGQSMQVSPAAEGQAPYLTVSLRRAGPQWLVVGLLPVRDRDVIRPYLCAEPQP